MLNEETFMGAKHIVMDKLSFTYVMNRNGSEWIVCTIPKIERNNVPSYCLVAENSVMSNDDAYEFYRERMESFGYKPFPYVEE